MMDTLSTRSDPATPGTDAFISAISQHVFPVAVSVADPAHFAVDMQGWHFGEILLMHLSCDAIRYRREQYHLVRAAEDELLITFSVNTRIAFEQEGFDLGCKPGQFLVERSGAPYDFVQEAFGESWALKVPARALRQRGYGLSVLHPAVFDARQGVGRLLFDLMTTAPERVASSGSTTSAGVGDVIVDLLALAIASGGTALGGDQGSVRRAHLARIELHIRRNLADVAMSPRSIAGANGVSLRYLHKLFEEAGTSVTQWINEQRLLACDADLRLRPAGATIAEVCHRRGFKDAAHFSRLYKARFGMTPRRRLRPHAPEPVGPST